MLVLRKVAIAASAGHVSNSEFSSFWPLPERLRTDEGMPSWSETPKELRERILKQIKGE